ncbi:MAG: MBL fold metallo-hydrolase [Proteobacteria bacterium]|nr:MBL fold metallo-hydrolase [Pseudomonadota bacterium]
MQRYGGNTSCIELRCGEHLLILDAGTGLRPLGDTLVGSEVDADLLLTHTHLDHIGGLGFFEPLTRSGTQLRLHGGHLPAMELRAALAAALSPPLMPELWKLISGKLSVDTLPTGRPTELHAGLRVGAERLRHPGGAVGFRIEWQGRSVAYVTDTEHQPGALDPAVLRLARDTDIFIYDSNYTDEEFPHRVGWGHSTWQEGVRLANAAGARTLVLFHHDPWRSDAQIDMIAQAAAAARPGTVAAAEGVVLTA